MHPVYRQLLAAVLLLITVISTCNKCQKKQAYEQSQKGWNNNTEQQLYDMFYTQSSSIAVDETARKQFAQCCVDKVKQMFPEGVSDITSNMNDSLKLVVMKMGMECGKSFQGHVNVWQPELIKQFKLRVYSYPEVKMLPEEMKQEYVDCVTFKVKSEFPNGPGENDDVLKEYIDKTRTSCLKLIVNKYGKRKRAK